MTATVTVLRYGPERNGRLAYPEGYDACLRLRNLYTKQRKETRPLFQFVAATPEEVSQQTAQIISDADRIEVVKCVNSYGLDAYVKENYGKEEEGGIAKAVGKDKLLRMLGEEAGKRLRYFINNAIKDLGDGQHSLVIVDGFDLAFWARETVDLQALKVYEALTGYKGTRAKPGAKVFYQGISPLEAATLAEEPVFHLPLPAREPWAQVGAREPVFDDNEVIVLDSSNARHKKD